MSLLNVEDLQAALARFAEPSERDDQARLGKQEAIIARQHKQIEALTAAVQKVSNKVEMNRTDRPRIVVN